ncbi:hypothetical protein AAMO2058_001206200 [Amorphochlora amoebiformis]
MSAGGEVDAIHRLLDERDARERICFEDAFRHCDLMHKSQRQLKTRTFELERRLVDVRSSSKSTSDPMTMATIQNLEVEMKQKDEELQRMYRQQATVAQKMIELNDKVETNSKEVEKRKLRIQELEEQVDSGEKRVEDAFAVKKRLEGENEVLRQEIESSRKNLEEAHEEIRKLAKENQTLIERLLSMKNAQAEEMNEMNDMYEKAVAAAEKASKAKINDKKYANLPDKTGILDKMAWQRHFNVQLPKRNIKAIRVHKGQASAIAYDKSGKTLVSCGTDAAVRMLDTKSGSMVGTLSGPSKAVLDIEYSLDDKLIIAAGNDMRAIVWSAETKRMLATLTGHTNKICACAFANDSKKAYTGSHDRTVRIWDLAKGACREKIPCGSAVNYLSVCAGGNILGTAHMDCSVRLWSARDGNQVAAWTDLHTRQATSVEFSEDGIHAVTNSRDNTLRLIDIRTYNSIKVFKDPAGNYRNSHNWNNACFSPDGKYVVAGSRDSELFFWNVKTGKLEGIVWTLYLRDFSLETPTFFGASRTARTLSDIFEGFHDRKF